MTETTTGPVFLTPEAHDLLRAELAERTGPRRTEIARRIEAAREEGDLKENGGYHAAKDEQGKNEARVRVLKHLLEHAVVGVPDSAEDEVSHGKVVTVRFTDGMTERFLLGSREEAAVTDLEVYSPTSPLGSALLGARVGQSVSYEVPSGRTFTVEVVAVEPR